MEIELSFPPLVGGMEEGINDGNIETFLGDVNHYIARECAQNTIDAAAKEGHTVELRFDLKNVPISYFPALTSLKAVFKSCKSFWSEEPQIKEFVDNASELLKKETIPMLKVGDYETTGLTGDDSERTGRWYGLVRSRGVCNKTGGEGGSFGIGKSAALAASALRTVYYFTRTPKNIAFQGVSRLVTHLDGYDKKTQANGYIALYDSKNSEYYSLRDKDAQKIPPYFLRDTIGTDIYIPAYKGYGTWKSDLIVAVLKDFWCAIENAIIKFKIGNEVIDRLNLSDYIDKYTGINFFYDDRFYLTYKKGKKYETELPRIGKVKLYLTAENDEKSKEVVVMRKNLMAIDRWTFNFRKSFTGVFICDNDEGNELLRKMEPPRHDKWDPARFKEKGGKKIISSIKEWIRDCAQNLMPLPESPSFELSDIAKYLPDILDDDDNNEEFNGEGSNIPRENFSTVPVKPEVKSIPILEPAVNVSENDEDEEINVKRTPSGGIGGGGGGVGTPKGGNVKIGVKARFIYDSSDKSYSVVLRSKQDFKGQIALLSVGEDNETEQVYIQKAYEDSEEISVYEGNISIPIEISAGEAKRLKVFISQNEILSLRCVAYGD